MNARELIALLESLPDKALPVELYDRNGVEILRRRRSAHKRLHRPSTTGEPRSRLELRSKSIDGAQDLVAISQPKEIAAEGLKAAPDGMDVRIAEGRDDQTVLEIDHSSRRSPVLPHLVV